MRYSNNKISLLTVFFVVLSALFLVSISNNVAHATPVNLVKDINEFPEFRSSLGVEFGGLVYFNGCTASSGCELWRTDGTQSGTTIVKDIVAGPSSSNPFNLVVSGNKLFFVAASENVGNELWVSDGTVAGTK